MYIVFSIISYHCVKRTSANNADLVDEPLEMRTSFVFTLKIELHSSRVHQYVQIGAKSSIRSETSRTNMQSTKSDGRSKG